MSAHGKEEEEAEAVWGVGCVAVFRQDYVKRTEMEMTCMLGEEVVVEVDEGGMWVYVRKGEKMGSGHSSIEERERSKEIDRYLRKERGTTVDILLLGLPESGKSTAAKRIKRFSDSQGEKEGDDSFKGTLLSYAPTNEIEETKFEVDGINFRLVDMAGGKESKGLQVFEACPFVIFTFALSDIYDKSGQGEGEGHVAALEYLRRLRKSPIFAKTSFVLLLTKKDTFEEKVKEKDLSSVIAGAPSSLSPSDAIDYVAGLFAAELKGKGKEKKEKEWAAANLTDLSDKWEETFLFPLFRSGQYHVDLDIKPVE